MVSNVDPAGADHDSRRPRADRPPRAATAGHLVGRAGSSETRVGRAGDELGGDTVLSFRLLTRDGPGSRAVQVRGNTIVGTVSDGDWVEVEERERSGRLEVSQLQNLTSRTLVRAVGRSSLGGARLSRRAVLVLIVLVVLLVVWVGLGMLGLAGDAWPFGHGVPLDGVPDGRLDPGST